MPKIIIEGVEHDYDPNRMLNTEAIALQKVTGMRVPEWSKALEEADAYALTALVWLLWRRSGRQVAFDEVEFDIGAIEFKQDLEPDPEPEVAVGPTEEDDEVGPPLP